MNEALKRKTSLKGIKVSEQIVSMRAIRQRHTKKNTHTHTHTHTHLILHLPYCDKGHNWRKLVLQTLGTPNTEKHTLAQHSPTSSLAPGTGLGMI